MRFIDGFGWVSMAVAVLLSGCGSLQMPRTPAQVPPPLSKPDWLPFPPTAPYPPEAPAAPNAAAVTPMQAYRLRAAARIKSLNPSAIFTGELPDPLASIPVLQIHLNRDGGVTRIDVLRVPKFEPQTVEMAKAAVMRASPFGFVGNLPQPWSFSETFLYNDALKFQLRSLVEGE